MVKLNKDERVWVCFEMARMQNAHAVRNCGITVDLAEEFLYYHPCDTQELQKIHAAWH